MFQNGITLQMPIRSMGPWGESFVGRYVGARFREGIGIGEHEAEALQSYFYHISAAMPSGEHALRHIFHPIAWGKKPLEGRMEDLKVPVSFIYGESDWMTTSLLIGCVDRMKGCQGIRTRLEGSDGFPRRAISFFLNNQYPFILFGSI